jgi:hypothetical protein
MGESVGRQAGVLDLTPAMINAGVVALWESGIVEYESGADRMVICEILQASLGAAGIDLRIPPAAWQSAETLRRFPQPVF